MAGRGWAWTAYDWDEGRLFNYVGDTQNTYPIWNATPLVALDVYEHAYFLDFQTDRGAVHRRLLRQHGLGDRERLGREVPDQPEITPGIIVATLLIVAGYLAGSLPFGYWLVRAC